MTAPTPAGRVDRAVVIQGAAGGLILAMAAALANVGLEGAKPKPTGPLFVTHTLVLVGFVLAGYVAGLKADREVARHGSYAAIVAFVPVEIVAILGHLDHNESISAFGVVFTGFFAAVLGMAGANLAVRRRNRSQPGGPS